MKQIKNIKQLRNRIIAMLLLVITTISMTGCENTYLNSSNPSERFGINYESLGDSEIINYYKQAEEYANKVDTVVVQHMNRLSFDMLKASNHTDTNIISPVGSYLSLALLYSAISGDAKQEFDEALQFNQAKNSDLNKNIHDLLLYLYRIDANTKITYANSVYVPKSIVGSDAFLGAATNFLFSRMSKINFTNQEAVLDEVNQWVSNYTRYRIDSVLDQVDSETKALAINAFHYEALTTTEFLPIDYFPDDFYGINAVSTVDYMRTIGNFGLFEDEDVQIIKVPLGRKMTSITFLIPKNRSSKEFLTDISIEKMNEYIALTKETSMELTIPQMTLESTNNMNELLSNMGASSIFTKPGGLNGLSEDTTITQMIHKVGLTLDKTDTSLSKIDVLDEMTEEVIMEYEEYVVNKPFLFVIKDHTTDTNILIGNVDNMGY